ncbi:MAG: hypothetical protein H7338_16770 [Candidatus Sericytochromatia bacterium]|nr:hypothetical protein [Candidatus Sericytochromatia bacterium]
MNQRYRAASVAVLLIGGLTLLTACKAATGTAVPSASPNAMTPTNPTTPVIGGMRFVDQATDRIGATSPVPDGIKDGHFIVTVVLPAISVTSIGLYAIDADGNPCCNAAWASIGEGTGVVGVYEKTATIVDVKTAAIGPLAGTRTFDIYVSDTGNAFAAKQRFQLDFALADGTSVSRRGMIN